jgi:phospholipid-binding lipoprotein MlaA
MKICAKSDYILSRTLAAAVIAAGVLSFGAPLAHAGGEDGVTDDINDPLEPLNRGVFAMNRTLDEMLFKPLARLYIAVVPEKGRVAVGNIVTNLGAPVVLVNDLLQGDMDRAGATLGRFMVNTTIGFGGMNDVAADMGVPRHSEDFGQTIGSYGGSTGPFLMLPLLGPSNFRDGIGTVVDGFLDPVGTTLKRGQTVTRFAVEGLDKRANFLDVSEAIEKTSLDYYASIRSVYLQNRAYEIRNGAPAPLRDIYGFNDGPRLQQATRIVEASVGEASFDEPVEN